MRRPTRLPALAAALTLSACTGPAMPNPSPPPGAVASVEEGPQELRLDDVVLQIREALQDKARPLDVATYRLPVDTPWPAVAAHYADASQGADDARLPPQLRGAQARAWRREGHTLAIALIPGPLPGGDPRPLLVVARD